MAEESETNHDRREPLLCVAPYDEAWPMMYTIEAERLRPAFGTLLAGIEHVGSTAVPGLAAKPIIDILIAVGSWEGFDDLKNRLGTLGYEFTPFPDTDDPRVFRRGPLHQKQLRSHHVHVTSAGSSYWRRLLAFRDYLRHHPYDASSYAQLKQQLAERFADDPSGYTNAKTRFVRAIETQAGLPRSFDRWK